ncbi:hypothetical protein EPA93_18190 [Ktedonosporobacter rubrisoli]|uniref:Uncharacterized protein n=1 Tax=Ktedonosporobacter rubrisoli TaxID=2509675 RepID=A0A4P6JQV5_KTERU|nr:hypothetical protein [Ktedonosporobacter rubrisoli]QBD77819.1 hypothetical protein EPA93_18190 [Ktedonosporobacter rubrisoli]
MRIRIALAPYEQDILLPALKAKFPDLTAEPQSAYSYYNAYLDESPQGKGIEQAAFLRFHRIHYIDAETEQQRAIELFLLGVEIAGAQVKRVSFPGLIYEALSVILEDQNGRSVLLRFPAGWAVPLRSQIL